VSLSQMTISDHCEAHENTCISLRRSLTNNLCDTSLLNLDAHEICFLRSNPGGNETVTTQGFSLLPSNLMNYITELFLKLIQLVHSNCLLLAAC
jgi:hypothetical protein